MRKPAINKKQFENSFKSFAIMHGNPHSITVNPITAKHIIKDVKQSDVEYLIVNNTIIQYNGINVNYMRPSEIQTGVVMFK